ncbi:MAG: type II toxin-antitoxin system RelE/ParE family toxin [Gammaproteobacteria bacterium]|nr:type II toxin-antitoxin system RelE/ParE family toxin [Gammaproteobacteria bacterium]MDE0364757.1 type II toxin-antitoxin system RelE/ParE family toxin [Gammaproteobacteria bacterium]
MSYSIRIKRSARKELFRIARPERHKIVAAIDALAGNPFVGSALKGQLQGLRRIRVGDYRVVYEIQQGQLVVLVIAVAHRREVYRR